MTTFDAGNVTLEKIREYVWELPQEGGMRVPGRVLASEALLEEIADDRSLQQLENTTHLPGIQKYALALPDAHQGYGFPVGGVAGIDAEDGCISPGAIGYDINCLPGETAVRLQFGRRREIADLVDDFETEQAVVAAEDGQTASTIRLLTEREGQTVYELETETGDTIEATADHPFLTPDGMVELGDLEPGDTVYVSPFRGIDDEPVEEFTVLTEEDFADENPQIRRVLNERDVLPLKSTDETFQHLLKLVGYHTGDGAFTNAGLTSFYGDPEDLEAIGRDIERVGFTASPIYSRERSHEVDGTRFETTEHSIRSSSRAFQLVMQKLGAPAGKKVESEFTTPWYFDRLTDWQKRLYLSAYFGAEMNAPAAQHDKNLYCPKISQTRTEEAADAGEQFMREVATFLDGLGIETNSIERFDTDSNSTHDTVRLRLGVKNDSENLIRFYSTVGYTYNREKQRLAAKAIQYLKSKERTIDERARIAADAQALADGGTAPEAIKEQFDINGRFIERGIWGDREGGSRPPADLPGFEEYCEQVSVAENLTVETTVSEIREGDETSVYDIGVEHEAHNFLAEGFVVSNCGVRMLKTNLSYEQIQGHEERLVDALFANVPTGLGGGGIVEGAPIEDILQRGVEWAVEEGHGIESDLAHCEDEGVRRDADPGAISQKAKDRGRNQVGSLGSGNHFLEVQRVTDIYREDVAEQFGLEPDQIVVLIHCGSRGLGHQVCTDYLRDIEQTHQGLLSQLPDKELAAAPAGSQLAEEYYGAMCAAINFAWVNRQVIMHQTRRVFERVFDRPWQDMEMELLYDVAHNIGKKEVHDVDGQERELYVHRKGATRAFPAGRPELPPVYSDVGQPIIIPGSMGAGSYILRGGENSLGETFGSTAHGAGRLMSRTQAKQEYWGGDVMDDLREQERIYIKAESGATVAEEAPGVYKDVDEVVRVSDALGIGDRVARTYPVCNIKG
jgi:tRNA-splicing ligase RtcB